MRVEQGVSRPRWVIRLLVIGVEASMKVLRVVGRFLGTMLTGISVLLVIAVVLWALAAIVR